MTELDKVLYAVYEALGQPKDCEGVLRDSERGKHVSEIIIQADEDHRVVDCLVVSY